MTSEPENRLSEGKARRLPFENYRVHAIYNNGEAMAEFIEWEAALDRFIAVLKAYMGPSDTALSSLTLEWNALPILTYSRRG